MGRLWDYYSQQRKQQDINAKAAALEAERVAEERRLAGEAGELDRAEFRQEVKEFLEVMRERRNCGTKRIRVGFGKHADAWLAQNYFWSNDYQFESWGLYLTVQGEWIKVDHNGGVSRPAFNELSREDIRKELAKRLVETENPPPAPS